MIQRLKSLDWNHAKSSKQLYYKYDYYTQQGKGICTSNKQKNKDSQWKMGNIKVDQISLMKNIRPEIKRKKETMDELKCRIEMTEEDKMLHTLK